MKKAYETPSVEVVEFKYRDQVVVASAGKCPGVWNNTGDNACVSGTPEWVSWLN